MSAPPFVVDEAFKRKISYLKVTELHTLLRNLGVSYQANKDQLVKRLIVKYSHIYEQYLKGNIPYEEAKRYGDWINENNIIYIPPTPTLPPAKYSQPPPPSSPVSRQKPMIITQSSYGGDLTHQSNYSSNSSSSSNSNNNNNNNNNYYNYMYAQQTNSGTPGTNRYYPGNGINNQSPNKPTSSYAPTSSSTKSSSIDIISYKPPPELVFPKSSDPFLEIETTLGSARLKTYAESRGRPTSVSFAVPDSYLTSVRAGTSRAIVRSFEVSNNLAHISTPHAWPPDCTLSVNGTYMALGIKKQTKPNAPPHPDKPLDISKECRSGRSTIEITTSSSRHYAIVIDVMRVISVDTLVDAVMKNKTANFESAKKLVSLALGGDDKDIAALHTVVSLQCPLGRTPLVLPAKSLACRHIQCFDLRNYLMMNQRTPSWKCPICSVVANTANLVIDAYFTELLRSVDSNTVTEVNIDPSGNWSTVKPHKSVIPKPEPVASVVVRAASVVNNQSSATPSPSPQKPKRVVEVIDLLSDDDDDDVVPVPPKRPKTDTITINKPPPPPRTNNNNSNNHIVISSPPLSPPIMTLPAPPTTTSTYSYPIISSPLSPLRQSNSSISIAELITLPPNSSPRNSPPRNSPLRNSSPRRSSTSIPPPTLNIRPNGPIISSPMDTPLLSPSTFSSEATNFEPNLQSDLAPTSALPATSDTPPEKKKTAIIVKLKLAPRPLPPLPNGSSSQPSQSTQSSQSEALQLSQMSQALQLTSPPLPTSPPPTSVPSESSDSLSGLEVSNYSPPGNSTGHHEAYHHSSLNSPPPPTGEYGHHWHRPYPPSTTTHSSLPCPSHHHEYTTTLHHHDDELNENNTQLRHPHTTHCNLNYYSQRPKYINSSPPPSPSHNYREYHSHSHSPDHYYSNHYSENYRRNDYHTSHPPAHHPYNYDDYNNNNNNSSHNNVSRNYHNDKYTYSDNFDIDPHLSNPSLSHPTSHHSSPPPSHPTFNGYFEIDEDEHFSQDINTYPPAAVNHSPLPLSLPLPSGSTSISSTTTTTTTTTTTSHGSTTTTTSYRSSGTGLSQPIIVLSDDDDEDDNGGNENFVNAL